ncbi:AAA family ATPase [Fictibacillus halophilus]|uniref:AAA family ATPase n=1 Tax=Fictibacillus halophilus TaxID=1610490 RepID=UPI003626F35D
MFFIQMAGFPGAGKSTLAREIGKRTGAVVIDHDIVKSALLHSIDEDTLDPKLAGKISYNIDWSLIESQLSHGNSVIFDSPCFYKEMIEKGTELAKKYEASYKYIECILNDFDQINERLRNRNRMISQIKEANQEMFNYGLYNSKKPSDHKYLEINTNLPIDNYIDEVIHYILERNYEITR